MYWRCEICDKVTYAEFRSNHFQSGFHKRLVILIVRRYIITNPKPNKIDYTIKKNCTSKNMKNFSLYFR